ncbi:ABC transporter substrate-binding protein [Ramlibacter albus]|uniref:ABC transporter substrate-binding protein n=1 Tax=Ramlibacter albus TaxID=2079448 RepID=A0A923S5X3_9BURK|nr:ABC transporter substrate-binding protein [Ramlibacter albus]MBC5765592.1 ABC transporter substrate-binding protein [Ramlibacter albus]
MPDTARATSRRHAVVAFCAGVLAARFARAQAKVHRIGYLTPGANGSALQNAFFQGMRALGYVEGANLAVEKRFTGNQYELFPGLAAELVKLKMDVIVAVTTPAALAVQKASSTIPTVAISVSDPVASGLASSLGRPGGNVTGMSDTTTDLAPKLLELLKSLKPALARVALLVNPGNPNHLVYANAFPPAATQFGVAVARYDASSVQELERAFTLMADARPDGLVVATDAFLYNHSALIAKLALANKLPAVFAYRQEALNGGLMSYGPSSLDLFRRAAGTVDKILRGAKPGELPFEQPTLFDLVVNLKTANALGIKVPQSLLVRATEVVE